MILERIDSAVGNRLAGRDDFVERGDGVTGAHLTGVLAIVVEVFFPQHPVLVADEAIRRREAGIELNLELDVLGDGHERRSGFRDQHAPRFLQRIEVRVVAVPLIRQHLHRRILEIGFTDAEDGQEDPALALALDEARQFGLAGDADVEVAVGGEDDAVDAVLDEVLAGEIVGQLDTGGAVGRAAGVELLDGSVDGGLLVPRCRLQSEAAVPRVGDDRDAVLWTQGVDQHLHRGLDQRQAVGRHHRSGDIEQEREVARRCIALLDRLRAQPDQRELVLRIPRACGNFRGDRHRRVALRGGIVVLEVVDQLLNANRIRWWQLTAVQEATDVGV